VSPVGNGVLSSSAAWKKSVMEACIFALWTLNGRLYEKSGSMFLLVVDELLFVLFSKRVSINRSMVR